MTYQATKFDREYQVGNEDTTEFIEVTYQATKLDHAYQVGNEYTTEFIEVTYQATKLDHGYQVGNEDTTEFMMGACDAANGYAPGEYMIRCHKCGQHKHGMDKRAITCAECAKKTRAAAAAAPPHFDIPYPPAPRADADTMRQMRDALQKAWLVLDALRTYRSDAELLALLHSQQMAEARQAVRQATALTVGAPR